MRLRDSIRPPARYSSDFIDTSTSNMSIRKKKVRIPLIEYDPTLPPAAFPTVDIQRERRASYARSIHGRESLPSSGSSQMRGSGRRGGRDGDGREQVDFQGIPLDELENYAASNSELNPVYTSNMAILGSLKEDSSSSLEREMEDSDLEVAPSRDEQQGCPEVTLLIPDPSWSDLCPQMQAEIFVNLLHYYKWSDVSGILGLTEEDNENIRKFLAARDEQIVMEDVRLAEMRERQLRALLMIDNSNRRHDQPPPELDFRKFSRQTIRVLKRSHPTDYLACPANDIVNAKTFLQKRGIDDRFVGEWAHCINPVKPSRDYTEPETPLSEDLGSKSAVSTDCPAPSAGSILRSQQSLVNTVDTTSATSMTDRLQSRGDSDLPSQWVTPLQQNYSESVEPFQRASQKDGLIRLQVDAARAAHVEKPEESISDIQSDNSPVPGLAPLLSLSMSLQQRTEEARVEALREMSDDHYDTDISGVDDEFSYPVTTTTPISRSTPRSPGIMRPDDDQDSPNFSDWIHTPESGSVSDDPGSDVMTEMSDEGNTTTSPVTPSALDSLSGLSLSTEDKYSATEDEECSEEEDEMILLPEAQFLR